MTAVLCGSGLRNAAGFLRVPAEDTAAPVGDRRPPAARRTDTPQPPAPLRPRRRPARHYMSRRAAGAEAPCRDRTLAAHGGACSEARPGLGVAPISRAATSESHPAPPLLLTAPVGGGGPGSFLPPVRSLAVRRPRGVPPWRRWGGGGAAGPGGARGGCGLPGGRCAAAAPG